MKKLLSLLFPALLLLFFIFIMLGGKYLKKPFSETDNVPRIMESVIGQVKNEEWDKAGKTAEQLEIAWNKVIPRIQFSVEREQLNGIDENIARLRGFITAKDKGGALAELSEIEKHWNHLGS